MRPITTFSLLLIAAAAASAQAPAPASTKAPKAKADTVLAKFFESETPIEATLTVNIGKLRGDKNGDTAPWRAATLSYTGPDSAHAPIPIKVKTRGIWRLKNCQFPPLRLNFSGEATKHTIFHGLDKPKLVNFCRDDATYEQYILQELQLYRVYRLLSPVSHAVRLLHLSYADSATGKVIATRYAFIEEEPGTLFERNGMKEVKIKGAGPHDLEPYQSALVGVFQYMIGNTDFAISGLHNIELVQAKATGDYLAVPYDFDFSGAVNARYATADPRLHIRNVRERIYRGFCVPADQFPKVFALFNEKKDAIYALYHDSIGQLLKRDVVDETLEYFNDFYKVINEPRKAKMEIVDACIGGK